MGRAARFLGPRNVQTGARLIAARGAVTRGICLGTAAFPENGQKRLVLLTDGNENIGDAMGAVLAAREQLGVTLLAQRVNGLSVVVVRVFPVAEAVAARLINRNRGLAILDPLLGFF